MIVVAFLFPLALYFFILGLINRRRRPLLVAATWDFAGLLLGASGFLAYCVPTLINSLCERWHILWVLGRTRLGPPSSDGRYVMWLAVSACYFLGVVLLAVLVLRQRRHQTAVYNIDPAVFEEVLVTVFDHLGLLWTQSGSRFFLRRPASRVGNNPINPGTWFPEGTTLPEEEATSSRDPIWYWNSGESENLTHSREQDQTATLSLDPSPAFYHVTLRWGGQDCHSFRQQIELELARVFNQIRTRHNPLGFFLVLLSLMLMTFNLLLVGVLVYNSLEGWPGP